MVTLMELQDTDRVLPQTSRHGQKQMQMPYFGPLRKARHRGGVQVDLDSLSFQGNDQKSLHDFVCKYFVEPHR
jgi:hypothetical protein